MTERVRIRVGLTLGKRNDEVREEFACKEARARARMRARVRAREGGEGGVGGVGEGMEMVWR